MIIGALVLFVGVGIIMLENYGKKLEKRDKRIIYKMGLQILQSFFWKTIEKQKHN